MSKHAFCYGYHLPWTFNFYKVRSLTPLIFAFAGFSAMSTLDVLIVGAPSSRTQCLVGHRLSSLPPHPLSPSSWRTGFVPSFGGASTDTQTHRLPFGAPNQSEVLHAHMAWAFPVHLLWITHAFCVGWLYYTDVRLGTLVVTSR